MTRPLVRPARPSDIDGLASALGHAFHDDPLHDYILPRGAKRAPAALRYFRLLLQELSDDLRHTLTTDELDGASIALPPGKHQLPMRRQLALLPRFALALGPERIPGGLRLIAHMDELHARFAPEPHYTLSVLAVVPERQGRGLGAALLKPLLERCDAEGMGIYLETSKASNVPFYERHGFELRAETAHPKFPTLWSMTRAPRAT